jgi:hypothetical protein
VTLEVYLKLYDPETGLLIASLPIHGTVTDAELEEQANTFLSKRAELLTLA